MSAQKPYSITHIVSIFAIMIMQISYNAFFYYYLYIAKAFTDTNIFFNAIVNISALVGASYYLTKIQISASGLSETTSKV
ncbi:MAG: hypothetical protein QW478_15160 [Candidatus Micrarchaeaceae archaeon]